MLIKDLKRRRNVPIRTVIKRRMESERKRVSDYYYYYYYLLSSDIFFNLFVCMSAYFFQRDYLRRKFCNVCAGEGLQACLYI